MPLRLSAALLPLIFAGAAFALPGMQSADVTKRVKLMTQIRDTTVQLSKMARGDTAFDGDQAARLAQLLRADTAAIPIHFEFQVIDPQSRARPEIWTDWVAFEQAAARSQAVADALQTETPQQMRRGLATLERTCRQCHRQYRVGD
ncbi:hypothetical protein P775_03065 [Puniceibacterium antarcticum]|uniref:Cytochrome C n=1 Tax=Puniceibacterium antarcticum TaxID=1206336 RepID=A0A2G8RJB0_9RHOB|nr:cytochrome c [Puniceibacterium antarcticum]PIL21655.1 hypothetical protein P775_03065 [Puniceibacterium antarcticum]